MDRLSFSHSLQNWISIDQPNHGRFKVVMQERTNGLDATKIFGENNADHRILNAAISLSEAYPRKKIILVSKDINLRLKAKSLNIMAEDFQTGKIKDLEALYTGNTVIEGLSKTIIDSIYAHDYCLPEDIGIEAPVANHYFVLKKIVVLLFWFFIALNRKESSVSKRNRPTGLHQKMPNRFLHYMQLHIQTSNW